MFVTTHIIRIDLRVGSIKPYAARLTLVREDAGLPLLLLHVLGDLLCLDLDVFYCAGLWRAIGIFNNDQKMIISHHVESSLRQCVVVSREDLFERSYCVLERDELALITSEDLRHLERLGHETLRSRNPWRQRRTTQDQFIPGFFVPARQ
jgi:hypothetical protein